MTTLIIILIILASVLLGFFVLIQNPKGGGLSAGFSGSSNLMGVQRTGDFLEKGTWGLIIGLIVLCLAINILGPTGGSAAGGLGRQIDAPIQSAPGLNLDNIGQPGAQDAEAPAIVPTEGEGAASATEEETED